MNDTHLVVSLVSWLFVRAVLGFSSKGDGLSAIFWLLVDCFQSIIKVPCRSPTICAILSNLQVGLVVAATFNDLTVFLKARLQPWHITRVLEGRRATSSDCAFPGLVHGAVVRNHTNRELVLWESNAHLTGEVLDKRICNVVSNMTSIAFNVGVWMHRRHAERVIEPFDGAVLSTCLLHFSVHIAHDLLWVWPQFPEELVRFHQIDEALETLAFLIDFLVLPSIQ